MKISAHREIRWPFPTVSLVPMLPSCVQERNGSSLQAITKHVGEKHPNLPGPWKKVLSNHVRKLRLSGKLVQVTLSAATLTR